MPDLSEEEIKEEVVKLQTAVYEKTGYEMRYIRPPKGEYSERTLAITNNLGYTTVMWSLAYDDWDEKKTRKNRIWKRKNISKYTSRSSNTITLNLKRQLRNTK